jgi:hypothetical protein
MLRRSSLVECVSVLHGTGVYKASNFFLFISLCIHVCQLQPVIPRGKIFKLYSFLNILICHTYVVWYKYLAELTKDLNLGRFNRLYWDMGDTSTKSRYFINDWYLEQIFSLYSCNYGFIYFMKISTVNQGTRIHHLSKWRCSGRKWGWPI